MSQNEQPILRVEGTDDHHTIKQLLLRHGIDIDHSGIDVKGSKWEGEDTGGKKKLLDGMRTEVSISNDKAIGFVLDVDADSTPEDCWRSVRTRLEGTGLTLPDEIPEGGFVGDTAIFQARVGVWLMPDNRRSGAIEEFLQDLIVKGDALLQLADTSTVSAKKLGAAFSDAKQRKALLHTWLAWQKNPGVPYGLAIKARYFQHDSPSALAFVDWFKRVFEEPMPDPRN